jgi:predicted nucleotidyltransferase
MMLMADEEIRAWIRAQLEERYGQKLPNNRLIRLILAGSRAKGTSRADSDWDVLAVLEGYKSVWANGVGPLRRYDKLETPDANLVETFELNPDDLKHPQAAENQLISEAILWGVSL